jgi:hypothetical protein
VDVDVQLGGEAERGRAGQVGQGGCDGHGCSVVRVDGWCRWVATTGMTCR